MGRGEDGGRAEGLVGCRTGPGPGCAHRAAMMSFWTRFRGPGRLVSSNGRPRCEAMFTLGVSLWCVAIATAGCAGSDKPTALGLTVAQDGSMQLTLTAETGYSFGTLQANLDNVPFQLEGSGPGNPGPFQPGGVTDHAGSEASAGFSLLAADVPTRGSGEVTVREGANTFTMVVPSLYSQRTVTLMPAQDPLRAGDGVALSGLVPSDSVVAPNIDFFDSTGELCTELVAGAGQGSEASFALPVNLSQAWWCSAALTPGSIVSGNLEGDVSVVAAVTACTGGVGCSATFPRTVSLSVRVRD